MYKLIIIQLFSFELVISGWECLVLILTQLNSIFCEKYLSAFFYQNSNPNCLLCLFFEYFKEGLSIVKNYFSPIRIEFYFTYICTLLPFKTRKKSLNLFLFLFECLYVLFAFGLFRLFLINLSSPLLFLLYEQMLELKYLSFIIKLLLSYNVF